MKKIVTIGGGSGQYVLLSAIRDLADIDIRAIVSMADSGGSTGRLRDELGVLPPGDVLKCVLALSPKCDQYRPLLMKRFEKTGPLKGHSVGNMLLTMLSQYTNDFPTGIRALGEILESRGRVLPVTTDQVTLVAELRDGQTIVGEAAIDLPEGEREQIKRTYLKPHSGREPIAYQPAQQAIREADLLIIGPGDFYTSITPNLLLQGIRQAVRETRAKIAFILNIMTKYGETERFSARDFILRLEEYLGREIDLAVANSARPENKVLDKYREEKADLVKLDVGHPWRGRNIIKRDLLNSDKDLARHGQNKLQLVVEEIIKKL